MDKDKKNCDCDCGCGHDHDKLPEDKVEDLKDALKKLGYGLEETRDGDIRVTN